MALRRYSPPIERVKDDYSRMLARRRMMALRGPRAKHPPTPDNSEPWIEEPKTVEELWSIAQEVQALADKWGPRN